MMASESVALQQRTCVFHFFLSPAQDNLQASETSCNAKPGFQKTFYLSFFLNLPEQVADVSEVGIRRSNMRDILPGEAVIIRKNCEPVIASVQPQKKWVIFARLHQLFWIY